MLISATKTKVFFTTAPTADEQCTNSESVVNSNSLNSSNKSNFLIRVCF